MQRYNFVPLLFYPKSFSDLLVRLRSHSQIGFDFLVTFGEFLFKYFWIFLVRGQLQHPLHLSSQSLSHAVIISQLQRINHPQNFIKVTSRAGRIGERETEFFIGVNHENRSHCHSRISIRVNHIVKLRNLTICIRQNWVVKGGALSFFNVSNPAFVRFYVINAECDRFDIALVKFWF